MVHNLTAENSIWSFEIAKINKKISCDFWTDPEKADTKRKHLLWEDSTGGAFMSGRKGMLHYKVEIKQEAVPLVLEEHMTYAGVTARIKAWVADVSERGRTLIP